MCEFLLIECEDQRKSDTFSVIHLFVEGTTGSYIINSIGVLDGSSHGFEENLLYVHGLSLHRFAGKAGYISRLYYCVHKKSSIAQWGKVSLSHRCSEGYHWVWCFNSAQNPSSEIGRFGDSLPTLDHPQEALRKYFSTEVKKSRNLWIHLVNWINVSR